MTILIRLIGGAVVTVDFGAAPAKCKKCKKLIRWGLTKNNTLMPISRAQPPEEGPFFEWQSHFADCPSANFFRKKSK
jgi:hypothetical protein